MLLHTLVHLPLSVQPQFLYWITIKRNAPGRPCQQLPAGAGPRAKGVVERCKCAWLALAGLLRGLFMSLAESVPQRYGFAGCLFRNYELHSFFHRVRSGEFKLTSDKGTAYRKAAAPHT